MNILEILQESYNRPNSAVNFARRSTQTDTPNVLTSLDFTRKGYPRLNFKSYKLLDLLKPVYNPTQAGHIKYNWSGLNAHPDVKRFNKAGIYVWSHPNYGILYVGLTAPRTGRGASGVANRWQAHAAKFINNERQVGQGTVNFRHLSELIVKNSKGDLKKMADDLADIEVSFTPFQESWMQVPIRKIETDKITGKEKLTLVMPQNVDQALHGLEDRLIKWLNPWANKERTAKYYNRDSSTRVTPLAGAKLIEIKKLTDEKENLLKRQQQLKKQLRRLFSGETNNAPPQQRTTRPKNVSPREQSAITSLEKLKQRYNKWKRDQEIFQRWETEDKILTPAQQRYKDRIPDELQLMANQILSMQSSDLVAETDNKEAEHIRQEIKNISSRLADIDKRIALLKSELRSKELELDKQRSDRLNLSA